MSKKYKFSDNSKLYFVSFSVTNWIDLFIRNEYREILLESIGYCQREKELELYGWCIMTSHVHLIIGTRGNPLSNIMRDLKRHTSEELHKAIKNNRTESRREWMLWMMERAATKSSNSAKFQLWQAESHPVELTTSKIAHQKLDYVHYNPVEAGFVNDSEEWKYSSAIDYNGGKGLLEIILLEPLIV
jgi:REP element-mobilizing transposase RayT